MLRFVVLALTLIAQPAVAQTWTLESQGGTFGPARHMAIAVSDSLTHALLMRCELSGEIDLVMITPDPFTQTFPNTSFLLKVDDGETISRPASMDGAPVRLRYTARLDDAALAELTAAREDIRVAIDVAGNIMHEHGYSTDGIRNALESLGKACSG